MKNNRLHLVFLALLGLSTLTINAAQLASAKVMSVSGTVTSYAEDGTQKPVVVGAILTQGDSISSTALSNAHLVFSNGSELTVQENTSVTIAALSQEAFGGSKSYEELQADPSKSQALLELNYGKVSGHVKQLKSGSEFNINTPLGTAAIRGTTFDVELRYNAERGEFILTIINKDGKVSVTSRYTGSIEYGSGSVGNVGYNSNASEETTDAIPPAHSVIIRLSKFDPNFDKIINALKNYPPFQRPGNRPNLPPIPPVITAEDTPVSPNQPLNQNN